MAAGVPDDQIQGETRKRVHREVVSFVLRSARMREPLRKTWDEHRDRLVIAVPEGETSTSIHAEAQPLDLAQIFGRTAPLIVEIGPGTGESLVPLAAERPDADFLAFEVFEPAAAAIVHRAVKAGLTNVRVLQVDAAQGLDRLLRAESIDRLWTFFPDPWHKARHNKRRLINAPFSDLVASRLKHDGLWRLATDWSDYATQMRDVLDEHPSFNNEHAEGWAPRWSARPMTRFEQRGIAADRHIFDLTYRRR